MTSRSDAETRLRSADWLRRPETEGILRALGGELGRTRPVGGIVRDTLLGRARDSNDIDMATELLPEEVMCRAGDAGIAAYATGIEHGTVTLKLGETLAEVTTLRQDIATDGRHAVVAFGTDWERDAERRDFTLNAMYADADGTLFDPIGGLDDCLAGRIRFIGDPKERIAEDRLRVFRFFRFSASHGEQHFDPDGLTACRLAAPHLGRLSAERVGAEMKRMLTLPKISLTLQAMVIAGVLALEPEVMRLLTSYELRASPPTFAGRLAIIIGGSNARTVQARWRLANEEVDRAIYVREAAQLLAAGRRHEAAYRYGPDLLDAIALAAIEARWTDGKVAEIAAELSTLDVPGFPISGRDLTALGYRQGRALGLELKRLEQTWIGSRFALDREALLREARPPAP